MISKERIDWGVMQAKSELARQGLPFAPIDLPALVAVILEAGDSGVADVEASAYRSGMVNSQ